MKLGTIDFVNALFEIAAVGATIINIRQILKDKCIHGVTVIAQIFYFAWSLWNVYFYYSYSTMFSYWVSVIFCLMNIIWLVLVFYFKFCKNK